MLRCTVKYFCSGIRPNNNNISADVTSLMRKLLRDCGFFFYILHTTVINYPRQILGGKMPKHTFYFLLTQGFTHKKNSFQEKKQKRIDLGLLVLQNLKFLQATSVSLMLPEGLTVSGNTITSFHSIINMRFSWNINSLSKYNRPH